MVNKRVQNAVKLKVKSLSHVQLFAWGGQSTGVSALASFLNITVIQVYAPTSNAEEAEVERFYEDLQDLLELTPKRDVLFIISSVQSLSFVRLFATPWIAARQASLSITNSRSSLRLTSIESVMPYSHLILGRRLLLMPPIPLSIRVISNESTLLIRWPKYWSFSFSIIPSKEIPGLISLRMDWLDLLAVQGTLESLLQHHNLKASVLWLSFLYGPTLTSIHDYW